MFLYNVTTDVPRSLPLSQPNIRPPSRFTKRLQHLLEGFDYSQNCILHIQFGTIHASTACGDRWHLENTHRFCRKCGVSKVCTTMERRDRDVTPVITTIVSECITHHFLSSDAPKTVSASLRAFRIYMLCVVSFFSYSFQLCADDSAARSSTKP
jgi:hypothetical protein